MAQWFPQGARRELGLGKQRGEALERCIRIATFDKHLSSGVARLIEEKTLKHAKRLR
jgi:hypothetical protein